MGSAAVTTDAGKALLALLANSDASAPSGKIKAVFREWLRNDPKGLLKFLRRTPTTRDENPRGTSKRSKSKSGKGRQAAAGGGGCVAATSVVEDLVSDHPLVICRLATAAAASLPVVVVPFLLSWNVMGSGERAALVPGAFANSFKVDPRSRPGRLGWEERFSRATAELERAVLALGDDDDNADSSSSDRRPRLVVVCLQEFPRRDATGAAFLEKRLRASKVVGDSAGFRLLFGGKDAPEDRNSQMATLVGPLSGTSGTTRARRLARLARVVPPSDDAWRRAGALRAQISRVQIVTFDDARLPSFVNLHPSPPHATQAADNVPFVSALVRLATNLIRQRRASKVHIIGDWNRRASAVREALDSLPPRVRARCHLAVPGESPDGRLNPIHLLPADASQPVFPLRWNRQPIDMHLAVLAA